MKIGIDKMGLHIPKYFLDIRNLAIARGIDPLKFTKGLMQEKMAVIPMTQDIVTMGVMSSLKILTEEDKEKIDLLILGTESGIDQSKAASTYIHSLLGINPFCRTFEIKQACYGATAALMYAKEYIKSNPEKKALVIAADIAKYEKNSSGESTQGAGAIAILVSKDPKIAVIEDESVSYTKEVMDFYRPNKYDYALVDGKLSNEMYLSSLEMVYRRYKSMYNVDFKNICFHIPYPKLGLKAVRLIEPKLEESFLEGISLNKNIGNIYTGSLFLSLYSLLSTTNKLKENDRIGMYSYGSGSVSEFFSLKLQRDFELEEFDLSDRIELNIEEYENMFYGDMIYDKELENFGNELVYLKKIDGTKRVYAINE